MGPEVVNKNKKCVFNGPYAGRDLYITMLEDNEREFVITHNADIKPVSYFTGRETELQELRQRIENGRKSVLVSGMGGIGKTHICRKLFEEYLNKYAVDENGPFRYIGYIEYNGDMGSSLQNCLKFKQQDSLEQNCEAAWRELEYLASDGKLLLFVDNVNASIASDTGLERLKHIPGAIILTSRRTSFSKEFEPYRIGFLSAAQCREIYEKIRFENSNKKVAEEEVPDLEYIIDVLAARHTITIEFLAHLAETKQLTAKELRIELESRGFLLKYRNEEYNLINIQEEYEKLYDLSVLTEAEQNILEAFSLFPYIPLAAEICNQWLLADAGASEDDDILIGLYRKGWLQFDMEKKSYALHPVFSQFIYEKCKPGYIEHCGLIDECRKSLEVPENGSVLEHQKYIPFAEHIIEKVKMENGEDKLRYVYNLAYLMQQIGEYNKAEKWYEIDIYICSDIWGEHHRCTASSYNNLAEIYDAQGKYEKAKEMFEKSLKIREAELENGHLELINSYNNLAGIYERLGEYNRAKGLYKRALMQKKCVLGENHYETAISYGNLAEVYQKQGEYKRSEKLYEKSLRICEDTLGMNHRHTATSYNNLAGVYFRQGEYEKAEKLYVRCIEIYESVLGKRHPDTARSYNNLANVYTYQGKYKRAEKLLGKSLEIREKMLGENHPEVASVYNNLSYLYELQNRWVRAKELSEKSLRIMKRVLGENHPDTERVYNNLATICMAQAESQKALHYAFKAYKVLISKCGLKEFDTKAAFHNMKLIYLMSNQKGNLEQWLEEKMKEFD